MTSDEASAVKTGAWRLADASSEYLRSAAAQPIEWFPWSEDAFERARRLGRPILLDIGAGWCHWCHVMDEGTYSDPEVARLIGQHFVAVKVDRDQNPEVDRRYQRQINALTGEGGWPLTGFLTPEGEAFLGGTYFPPEDGMGRPGFRRVLRDVARLWKEEPVRIQGSVAALRDALARLQPHAISEISASEFLVKVRQDLYSSFDPVNGGFGHVPKFPHPTAIQYLLWDSFATQNPDSGTKAIRTLQHMAEGGIYDQVAGGFHRYSVDESWHIPHFEKMAVDNAALLDAYVGGARFSGHEDLARIVRESADWSLAVLGVDGGGFGASQDADNAPGDDGSYFTWSREELKRILSEEELRLVVRYFGVGSEGRMPHDPSRNVLFRLMSIAEAAAGAHLELSGAEKHLSDAIVKMRAERARRPVPMVDGALYADLNGGYIRALAQAGRFLGEVRYLDGARAAADRFLRDGFGSEKGMAHRLDGRRATGFGHLDDQVQMAYGLIELAGTLVEPKYVDAAENLLNRVDREFRGEDGLLKDIAPTLYEGPKLPGGETSSYPMEDSPHLAGNGAYALATVRFASLTNRSEWSAKAEALLTALQRRIRHPGLFSAGTGLAAGLLSTPAARVVVEGDGAEAEALLRAADRAWHPSLWVFRGVPPPPFSIPEELASATGRAQPRALVCFGTRCLAPVTDPTRLPNLLRTGGQE